MNSSKETLDTMLQSKYDESIQQQIISLMGDVVVDDVHFPGPGIVKTNSVYGNYVVASRTIDKGELICVERPLLVSPYRNAYWIPVCLSCYKFIKATKLCSLCRWPICDLNCQQNPAHADNECSILQKRGLKPMGLCNDYFGIEVLRGLLLQTKKPQKWQKIANFFAHIEPRKNNPDAVQKLQFVLNFIQDKCKLTQFDKATIDHVAGVLSVNTFNDSTYPDIKRHASLLFDGVTELLHDCCPNAGRTLIELPKTMEVDSSSGDGDEHPEGDYFRKCGLGIRVFALRSIRLGEIINIRYVDLSQSVSERRKEIRNTFYFDCNCTRCLIEL